MRKTLTKVKPLKLNKLRVTPKSRTNQLPHQSKTKMNQQHSSNKKLQMINKKPKLKNKQQTSRPSQKLSRSMNQKAQRHQLPRKFPLLMLNKSGMKVSKSSMPRTKTPKKLTLKSMKKMLLQLLKKDHKQSKINLNFNNYKRS